MVNCIDDFVVIVQQEEQYKQYQEKMYYEVGGIFENFCVNID